MRRRRTRRASLRPGLAIGAGLMCAVSPVARAQTAATRVVLPSPWIPGWAGTVAGEVLEYHSPLPDVLRGLVVRSEDSSRGIEWTTAPVPAGLEEDVATFVVLAAIDASTDRREFVLSIDGRAVVRLENPAVAEVGSLTWVGERGVEAELRVTLVDRYSDSMGYLLLRVPRRLLTPGEPLRLSVAGESAGSRTWFMVFPAEIAPGIAVRGNPAVVRTPNGLKQTVRVDALYPGERSLLRMEAPGVVSEAVLDFGLTRLELEVPAVESPVDVPLAFEVDGEKYEATLRIEPVPPLDLYLIHHTHLDIGYTHVQEEVERLQWEYLEEALELGRATDSLPDEAHFVWHPEASWAIESYLATRSGARRGALLAGIRRGWIHVDALYANLLTGLATGEALVRTVQAAREIADEAGVTLRSAMLSDIPGMSRGVVPTLAQAGVRYLSVGPNRGHRIGSFLDTWADRPFWWESASGKERVLAWVHGGGYSMFHTGLGYEHLERRLDEELILAYADTLAARGWPYGIAGMRYNIGSDNGPPDSTLAATVEAWNERHVTPRLVISTVTDLFAELEARAGDELPVVGGDLTGYWSDGAASSARETALARRAAESLVQTEALAAMTGVDLPPAVVDEAWRDVLLFLEHTWGSWNSVSEPLAELTVSQWERKREFADRAALRARRLRARALGAPVDPAGAGTPTTAIDVLNSTGWIRAGVVVVPVEGSGPISGLADRDGRAVSTQRLTDGSLAFAAGEIRPWSARRYLVRTGSDGGTRSAPDPADPGSGLVLDNGVVSVGIDPASGSISSLRLVADGRELVPRGDVMDEYLYVAGRDPAAARSGDRADVRITDAGPLVWTAVIATEAPGTENGLETRIRVFAGSPVVEITHRFDKSRTYEPEAVLLRFPVAVEHGETVVSGAWGAWRAERDQAPGANRNYATMERWADVHDAAGGLQVVSVDVPGIQLGSIGTDATVVGWREATDPAPVFYSYVMNNYWETNYRAAQEGPLELRYTLRPHGGFDEAEAERFALEAAHPLVIVASRPDGPLPSLPFRVTAARSTVTLLRRLGEAGEYLVRLYNPSGETDEVGIEASGGGPVARLARTDPWGGELAGTEPDTATGASPTIGSGPTLAPREVATFRVRVR